MNTISYTLAVPASRWFLPIIFLLVSLTGNAQKHRYTFKDTYPENNTDSLEQWLKHYPAQDEERLKNLCKLERTYLWKLSPKLFSHLDDMKRVAMKINHKGGIAFARYMESIKLNMTSNNQLSEKYMSEAMKMVEAMNDISSHIGILSIQTIISMNYKDPRDNKIAEYYYAKAKALYPKTNDIHDQLFFLMAALDLENQRRLIQNNNIELLIMVNKFLSYTTVILRNLPMPPSG